MHCYIHIVNDNLFIRDPQGQEFADLASAEKEAMQTARDLMAEELRAGNDLPLRWKALVASSDDTILISLPFGKIVDSRKDPIIEDQLGSSIPSLRRMDQHISQGCTRVEEQRSRIARMEGEGQDTLIARQLLDALEGGLALLIRHRRLIHFVP